MVKCENLRINMFRITHTGKSVNFPVTGVSWTARAKLLLSYLNMTFFTVLLACDVPHHATRIGTFSKWPLIKR